MTPLYAPFYLIFGSFNNIIFSFLTWFSLLLQLFNKINKFHEEEHKVGRKKGKRGNTRAKRTHEPCTKPARLAGQRSGTARPWWVARPCLAWLTRELRVRFFRPFNLFFLQFFRIGSRLLLERFQSRIRVRFRVFRLGQFLNVFWGFKHSDFTFFFQC